MRIRPLGLALSLIFLTQSACLLSLDEDRETRSIFSNTQKDMPADAQDMSTDTRDMPVDAQDMLTDASDMAVDAQDMTVDAQDMAVDAQDMTVDAQDMLPDSQDMTADSQDMAIDAQDMTADSQDMLPDAQDMTSDLQDMLPDVQDMTTDSQDMFVPPVLCGRDDYVENNRCRNCPDGATNVAGDDANGSDTLCDCNQNERVENNTCVACPALEFRLAGDDIYGPNTSCSPITCPSNTYISSNNCIACPVGFINGSGDVVQDNKATQCSQVTCALNQRVLNNTCETCPVGSTNKLVGDAASAGDTQCLTALCLENEHVQSNSCAACMNSTNKEGDNPTGSNTLCDGNDKCPSNTYVSSNTCEQCPIGSTNDEGDLLNGGDTQCDVTMCAQDERVFTGECVACPANSTNMSGDDPRNGDTQCEDACFVALGVTCAQFDEAYVKASNTNTRDLFGRSIALNGNTLAVGSPDEDSDATGINNGDPINNDAPKSGAVYVFTRTNGVWTQQAYIKASNTSANDRFGVSVALDGDTLVVGADGEDSSATGIGGAQGTGAGASGAVYAFTRDSTTNVWTQQAYIKASNTGANDAFGESVALDGDTLVVGAKRESSNASGINMGDQTNNNSSASGAVYVFERSVTTWEQKAYIKAEINGQGDFFGDSIALHGDTLAVGAFNEDSNATGINNDATNNTAATSGAVYIFIRSSSGWVQQAYIKASNTDPSDRFGSSIALHENTLAVGAPFEDSSATGIGGAQGNGTSSTGAVYVFTRDSTSNVWTQQAYIKASNTGGSDYFGYSIALDGDTLAVGSYWEGSDATGINGNQGNNNNGSKSGAVYAFTRSGTDWTQKAYIKASTNGKDDNFGSSVTLDGNQLAISAVHEGSIATSVNGDQTNNLAINSGAVYVRRIAP